MMRMCISTDEFPNVRVYNPNIQKCIYYEKQGICGRVKIYDIKYHTMLQALSNIQAQRKHLRIYAKIEKLEQGKLEILRLSGL